MRRPERSNKTTLSGVQPRSGGRSGAVARCGAVQAWSGGRRVAAHVVKRRIERSDDGARGFDEEKA